MAIPTKTVLEKLDYFFHGEPFVFVTTKSTMDLSTMDCCYLGEPFWATEREAGISGVLNVTLEDVSLSSSGLIIMSLYSRPDGDEYDGLWTNELGGTTDLWESVNEDNPADADYVKSEENASNSVVVFSLSDLPTPEYIPGHVLRYRYGRLFAGVNDVSLTVQLREGYISEVSLGTLIAEWTHLDISETLSTAEQVLSDAEVGSITDYSDLFVRMIAEVV